MKVALSLDKISLFLFFFFPHINLQDFAVMVTSWESRSGQVSPTCPYGHSEQGLENLLLHCNVPALY